jgi:hypothetical protein
VERRRRRTGDPGAAGAHRWDTGDRRWESAPPQDDRAAAAGHRRGDSPDRATVADVAGPGPASGAAVGTPLRHRTTGPAGSAGTPRPQGWAAAADRTGWDRTTTHDERAPLAAAGRDDRAGWDTGPLGWDTGSQGWDTGAARDDRAGWDRDTAWGADQGWDGPTGWSDAPTDTAWSAAGSPVALLERRRAPPPSRTRPSRRAPAPERKHTVRHPLRLGLFALVLFGLVAGSVAWLSMDKSVTLTVDGEARAVKTYASTVGGVLDDQNITVGQHDTLAPPGRPGSPTAPRSCCAAAGSSR